MRTRCMALFALAALASGAGNVEWGGREPHLAVVDPVCGNEPGTDELIKKACEVVCKTYKHSPVFRVSTDEFTAILRGEDYHQRDELLRQMWSKCLVCQGELSLQIGSGMAVYDPERDRSFASVYQRAKALLSAGSDQE